MGQAATEDAVRLARDNPTLQIGWHLHLCDSQPITQSAWSWGNSHSRAGWAIGLSPEARHLMHEEVKVQWELYRATGLPCAFVNSHHHLHGHPFVYKAMLNVLPPKFVGWIRLGKPQFFSPSRGQLLLELWIRSASSSADDVVRTVTPTPCGVWAARFTCKQRKSRRRRCSCQKGSTNSSSIHAPWITMPTCSVCWS